MHAAYLEVGSYRGAVGICGTTPKTVKRSIEAARATEDGPAPGEVRHNFDGVADVVAETVARAKGRITHGQATAAGGGGRRLPRVSPQLPPIGGRGEGGLAVDEPPGTTTGHLVPG